MRLSILCGDAAFLDWLLEEAEQEPTCPECWEFRSLDLDPVWDGSVKAREVWGAATLLSQLLHCLCLSIALTCRNWLSFFFLFNSPVLSSSHIFLFFLLFSLSLPNPSIGVYVLCVLMKGPCLISYSDGGAFFSDVTLELCLILIFLSPSMEAESKVGISFKTEESWFPWSFKTVQMILWWWKDIFLWLLKAVQIVQFSRSVMFSSLLSSHGEAKTRLCMCPSHLRLSVSHCHMAQRM